LHVGQRRSSSVPSSTIPSPLHSGQVLSVIIRCYPREVSHDPISLVDEPLGFCDGLPRTAIIVFSLLANTLPQPLPLRAAGKRNRCSGCSIWNLLPHHREPATLTHDIVSQFHLVRRDFAMVVAMEGH
jgi:hypothetical protein